MGINKELTTNAFDFWQLNAKTFPKLAPLAIGLIGSPASSASIERIFSIAALGEGVKKRRNRLGEIQFTKETMIRANKAFIKYN